MLALLLQVSPLLFPQTSELGPVDPAFSDRVVAMADRAEWRLADVDQLRAEIDAADEFAAIIQLLDGGSESTVRLAALLATGQRQDELDDALLRAACTLPQEAPALACVLAPSRVPERWWPALLMLAQEPTATLPVRAAATARLMEAGLVEVWPLARSILRAGTRLDEPAPWADWKRGGRYELPKRLLVLSLDKLLLQHDGRACGFEPNAAWDAQVTQLEALELRIWKDGLPLLPSGQQSLSRDGPAVPVTPHAQLFSMAEAGDLQATRSLGILFASERLPSGIVRPR